MYRYLRDARVTLGAGALTVGAVCLLAVTALALAPVMEAQAALTLLKPTPGDSTTFSGHGGYSADGLGQTSPGGTIQAQVPAGSTVERAYLYGAYHVTDPTPTELIIDFDGTRVVLAKISNITYTSTARAEVTTQVAGKVGSGGATTDFVVNTDPANLDGVALVVIYSNPTLPATTVAVLDGSAETSGDSATVLFLPLDKSAPNFTARLSLGIGWSFQAAPGHGCSLEPIPPPAPQATTVNVNSRLLTKCAGNYDDGAYNEANGASITVGGVGDSTGNPTPPDNPPTDDELYDLAPFMNQGDTQVIITTSNPSPDDNLFLAVVQVDGQPIPQSYVRPKGATPFRASLVPAYKPCSSVNRTHGAPLSFPSCNPPFQVSDWLTIGSPDANGNAANSVGSVTLTTLPSPADVRFQASLTDIRNKSDFSDYTGQLQARLPLRVTDKFNGPATNEPGTGDTAINFTVPCGSTTSTTIGSTCSITTTANSVIPGSVVDGVRSVWELSNVQVFDGGPDGVASTQDNTLFATQGVFVP
jgi:hypothetical protein